MRHSTNDARTSTECHVLYTDHVNGNNHIRQKQRSQSAAVRHVWCRLSVPQRHSYLALLQVAFETSHAPLLLSPGVVALAPLALAEHHSMECAVCRLWCVVGGRRVNPVWGCF